MWHDPLMFNAVTYPRFTSAFPQPLGFILCKLRQRQARKRLRVLDWEKKDIDTVYAEVDNCCRVLSERLADGKFYFGDA
jgi:hypothetical protein